MTTTNKEPVLVVLQMTGGNDYLNTVIPYTDGMYYDYRPTVGVAEEDVFPIDSTVGLHPQMRPFKDAYDAWRTSPSFMAWATPTPRARTSGRWTSGTPVSRTPSAPRVGSERSSGSSTRTRRTSLLPSAWDRACSAPSPFRACQSRASTISTATD